MNNRMGKKITVIGILALLPIGAVFAKSYKCHIRAQNRSGNAVYVEYTKKDRNTAIIPLAHAPVGEWIARDEHKEVIIECEWSGTMEIEWKQGFTHTTEWEGQWTATDTKLTFTIRSKKTKTWKNGAKTERVENMYAVWDIQYSATGNTITLSGQDLPTELRGLTLFCEED